MLTWLASRSLVWARGLWSELHEHEFLEPAWLGTRPDEDSAVTNDDFAGEARNSAYAENTFEYSEEKQ